MTSVTSRAHAVVAGYRTSTQAQARNIKKLLAEKERYATEGQEAEVRFRQAQDEVKGREITVLQLQKRIAEGEAKLNR